MLWPFDFYSALILTWEVGTQLGLEDIPKTPRAGFFCKQHFILYTKASSQEASMCPRHCCGSVLWRGWLLPHSLLRLRGLRATSLPLPAKCQQLRKQRAARKGCMSGAAVCSRSCSTPVPAWQQTAIVSFKPVNAPIFLLSFIRPSYICIREASSPAKSHSSKEVFPTKILGLKPDAAKIPPSQL